MEYESFVYLHMRRLLHWVR